MDSAAATDEPPVLTLWQSAMNQPWVPGQRCRNGTAVCEIHGECVIGNDDFGDGSVILQRFCGPFHGPFVSIGPALMPGTIGGLLA